LRLVFLKTVNNPGRLQTKFSEGRSVAVRHLVKDLSWRLAIRATTYNYLVRSSQITRRN